MTIIFRSSASVIEHFMTRQEAQEKVDLYYVQYYIDRKEWYRLTEFLGEPDEHAQP